MSNAASEPSFNDDLENHVKDNAKCPPNRYILVPPANSFAGELCGQFNRAVGESHPFHGKYGWTVCLVTYRRSRAQNPLRPTQSQSIISVAAIELATLGRSCAELKKADLNTKWKNTVHFILDEVTHKVKLGPRLVISFEWPLRGTGVGSFCLSELISWAKSIGWGDAEVAKGKLGHGNAGSENINRRDRFYRGADFDIFYHACCEEGHFSKKRLSDLRTINERSKPGRAASIITLSAADAGIALAKLSMNVSEYERLDKHKNNLIANHRSQNSKKLRRAILLAFISGVAISLIGAHEFFCR